MSRPDWHTHWMRRAIQEADMSTCASGRKVGAVFIIDNHCVSSGFNGVPRKYPHPVECARRIANVPSGQSLDLCPCVHAEANGINNAARLGHALNECTVYCTTFPCVFCMSSLANVGTAKVIYLEEYSHVLSVDVAQHGNIELIKFSTLILQ